MLNKKKKFKLWLKKNKDKILLIVAIILLFVGGIFGGKVNVLKTKQETKTQEKQNIKRAHLNNTGNLVSDNLLSIEEFETNLNGITLQYINNTFSLNGVNTQGEITINLKNKIYCNGTYYMKFYDITGTYDRQDNAVIGVYLYNSFGTWDFDSWNMTNATYTGTKIMNEMRIYTRGKFNNYTFKVAIYNSNNEPYNFEPYGTFYNEKNNGYLEDKLKEYDTNNYYNNSNLKTYTKTMYNNYMQLKFNASNLSIGTSENINGKPGYYKTLEYQKEIKINNLSGKYYYLADYENKIARFRYTTKYKMNVVDSDNYNAQFDMWYLVNVFKSSTESINFNMVNNIVNYYTTNYENIDLDYINSKYEEELKNTYYEDYTIQNIVPYEIRNLEYKFKLGFETYEINLNTNIVGENNLYQQGFEQGLQKGVNNTVIDKYNNLTYNEILELGKEQGRNENYKLTNEIGGLVNMPFNFAKDCLNFTIFGLNVSDLFMGCLTILLVIFVIKKVI